MAGINKIDNFNIYKNALIDSRGYFATVVERDALNVAYRKEGLLTYCADTQTLYCLIGGTDNANWVAIGAIGGATKDVITENSTPYSGIEIGTNVFTNTKGVADVLVQFKDTNGNVLNFNPKIEATQITISSAKTYPGAKLIIL
jgi:hypothetical protein